MSGKHTFTVIKPNAVAERQEGKIIDIILHHGFNILALKKLNFSRSEAEAFYEVHKNKYFFHGLIEYMISGPVYIAVLEKENCVSAYRKVIGATDPKEAEPGTIRNQFGKTIRKNAVHGSDSDENAAREIALFFPNLGY